MMQSCADVISQSGVDSQRGVDVMLERWVRDARYRPVLVMRLRHYLWHGRCRTRSRTLGIAERCVPP